MDQKRNFYGVISTNVSAMKELQLAEGTFASTESYAVWLVPESYISQIKKKVPDASVSCCSF